MTTPTTPASDLPKLPSRRGFLRGLGLGLFGFASGVLGGNVVSRWYENLLAAPDAPRTGVDVPPITVKTAGGLTIHRIQTGYVAVKQVHRSYDGPDGQGILAIASANMWTEWLPITAWVIEHPEGVLVIDTGEEAAVNDPTYMACDPASAFFYNSFLRFAVTREEELVSQMSDLGIRPSDVRWVVQTHLHGDHVHGLKHFSQSEVLVSPLDYPSSLGAVPCLYPTWLNPTLVNFSPSDVTGFGRSYPVTQAGDVLIVPTPGHSTGHQSVLIRESGKSYLIAGDASFDEAQMLAGGVAGIASDPSLSRQTLASIRAYCAAHPTVYLPSHDHDTPTRLAAGQVVGVG